MLMGNIFLVTGALLSSQSTNLGMFIGGRFLTGFGSSWAAVSARSYMVEITPAKTRGRWLGLLNSFYYVGQILASGLTIPFGRGSSEWAWRAPILLQGAPAVINILFGKSSLNRCILTVPVLLLPESPRWLYAHGQPQKAVEVLAYFHSRDMDVNSPIVQYEIAEIEAKISMEGGDKRWWDFKQVFNTRADRYRWGIGALEQVGQTWAGNGLITCPFALWTADADTRLLASIAQTCGHHQP